MLTFGVKIGKRNKERLKPLLFGLPGMTIGRTIEAAQLPGPAEAGVLSRPAEAPGDASATYSAHPGRLDRGQAPRGPFR